MDFSIAYGTIAEAENAVLAAGFKRDNTRAMWLRPDGASVKVVRGADGKFYVSK